METLILILIIIAVGFMLKSVIRALFNGPGRNTSRFIIWGTWRTLDKTSTTAVKAVLTTEVAIANFVEDNSSKWKDWDDKLVVDGSTAKETAYKRVDTFADDAGWTGFDSWLDTSKAENDAERSKRSGQ